MRVVAIVQARTGSTRLPAKVLLDLGGATALQRCVDRVRRIRGVSEVVIATTVKPEDDVIVSVAKRLGVPTSRGSETDVLSRYHAAAKTFRADAVVRCTSDCPLLDPEVSSLVVEALVQSQGSLDFTSNSLDPSLPRGLDTEACTMAAMEKAQAETDDAAEREHVMLHFYRVPGRYRIQSVLPSPKPDLGHHRWTLDTFDDYRMLNALFEVLGPEAATAGMERILEALKAHPEIAAINAHVKQKQV
jgi:spore coat polysaccharide biosynthesis protein SpsF